MSVLELEYCEMWNYIKSNGIVVQIQMLLKEEVMLSVCPTRESFISRIVLLSQEVPFDSLSNENYNSA